MGNDYYFWSITFYVFQTEEKLALNSDFQADPLDKYLVSNGTLNSLWSLLIHLVKNITIINKSKMLYPN